MAEWVNEWGTGRPGRMGGSEGFLFDLVEGNGDDNGTGDKLVG